MQRGDRNRQVGCTNMNERSSRSHTIFRIVSTNAFLRMIFYIENVVLINTCHNRLRLLDSSYH